MKRFYVVLDNEGVERHPMKLWLRENQEQLPKDCDYPATRKTSHQLRDALLKTGWAKHETPSEVLLTPPGVILTLLLPDDDDEVDDLREVEFTLEYQLRDFLAQNLETISVDGKKLRLFVDDRDKDGVEYPTDVGPIDILAVDEIGAFVVFELKRARSPDRAIGQLSRYMGWVKHTIGKGKDVRGVIVAKTISRNLRYAVTVIPDVSLFEYEVRFTLNPVAGPEKVAT
ncbi:MAG: endonuclease NucS [Rhodospirillaceae bacterium]|nr:endonuclease NucS [Rhodospirillaceae bacterium]